jgi:hypothetical protein
MLTLSLTICKRRRGDLICAAELAKMRQMPAFCRPVQGETIVMRLILVTAAAAVLLAACASTAPQKPTREAQAPAPIPASTTKAVAPANTPTSDKFATIDATNIAEAQKAGYKIVNENGTQLFCRRELITGTRLHYKTSCLTGEQLHDMNNKAADAMRTPPIPYYTPGGRQ